jgi:hypothetical protein
MTRRKRSLPAMNPGVRVDLIGLHLRRKRNIDTEIRDISERILFE